MHSTSNSSTFVFPLALTLGVAVNLFSNLTSWGQAPPPTKATALFSWQTSQAQLKRTRGRSNLKNCSIASAAPTCFPLLLNTTGHQNLAQGNANTSSPNNGAVITEIRVRFLNQRGLPIPGRTRPFIITREFDLRPGDIYNQKLAQFGLQRVSNLDIVRRASLTLKPTGEQNRVVMVVNVVERNPFTASLSTDTRSPSALPGPFQPRAVSPGADIDSGFAVGGSAQLRNLGGNNQNLALRITGGARILNGELSFTDPWIAGDGQRTGYSVNVFNQRAVQSVFTGGDRNVNLSDGGEAWVHRLGGGVQFFRPLASDLTAALGLSYQQVSVRDDMFSSILEKRDQRGNRLTFSDREQDDLLALSFRAALERRNDKENPTSGSRVLVGIDQSIPIGEANILFTRLSANYLQYIPLPLFGFTTGSRTLILNLQAGTMLGDVPGYEAFNLSAGLTRGFGGGGIGTGRSFVEATAQYNFPVAIFSLFKQKVNLNGELFVDYASDLNSGASVLGKPAIVRSKPGEGLGYGFGLSAKTSFGTATLEFAWSDTRDNQVIFTLGERF